MNIIEQKLKDSELLYAIDWDITKLSNIECIKSQSKTGKGKFPYFFTWYVVYNNSRVKINRNRDNTYPFVFCIFCKDCKKQIKTNLKLSSLFSFAVCDLNYLDYSESFSTRCKKCSSAKNGSETKEKAKATCLDRYGYEYNFQMPDFKQKSKQTKIQKYGTEYKQIASLKGQEKYLHCTGYSHNMKNPECVNLHKKRRSDTISKRTVEERLEFEQKRLLGYKKPNSPGLFGKLNAQKRSKISIDFYENLIKTIEYSICIEHQIGPYIVDFLIPNICIIEFNGTFWHADPRVYKEDDVLKRSNSNVKYHYRASEIWKKDCNRIKFIVEQTRLPCIVVWEHDYKTDKRMTIETVLKQISSIKTSI